MCGMMVDLLCLVMVVSYMINVVMIIDLMCCIIWVNEGFMCIMGYMVVEV